MKFENVRPGDVVYVVAEVRVGWSTTRSFWVCKKVDKVTAKQFTIGGKRYRKLDGQCIGGDYIERAANLSDDTTLAGPQVVDQTKEMEELAHRIRTTYEIREIVSRFSISYTHPELDAVREKLEEVQILLQGPARIAEEVTNPLE